MGETLKWVFATLALVLVSVLYYLSLKKSKKIAATVAACARAKSRLAIERSKKDLDRYKEKYYEALKKNKKLLGVDDDVFIGTLITFTPHGFFPDEEPDTGGESGSMSGGSYPMH